MHRSRCDFRHVEIMILSLKIEVNPWMTVAEEVKLIIGIREFSVKEQLILCDVYMCNFDLFAASVRSNIVFVSVGALNERSNGACLYQSVCVLIVLGLQIVNMTEHFLWHRKSVTVYRGTSKCSFCGTGNQWQFIEAHQSAVYRDTSKCSL